MVMKPIRRILVLPALGLLVPALVGACGAEAGDGTGDAEAGMAVAQEAAPVRLGPADGHGLPATELERVAVGSMAPDFSLQTLNGDTLTLSSFRGEKDVILVFYRGHW